MRRTPRPSESAGDEIALGAIDARLLAHTQSARLAVAPLAGIARVVGEAHGAEAVQAIVLEVAGLALAVAELDDAQALALAVAHLADIAHAVVAEPLGVRQIRPRGARSHDARLARHGARGPGGFVGAFQHRLRRHGRARGLIDQGLLGRIGRRCGRGSRPRQGGVGVGGVGVGCDG